MVSRDNIIRRRASSKAGRRSYPRGRGWFLVLSLGLGLLPACAPALAGGQEVSGSPAEDSTPPADFAGLWAGQILYAPAEIELEVLVELAADAEGNLVGNVDVPSQKMKYYPLTSVTPQGRQITFDFHKDSEKTLNARFLFEGELSEGGEELSGIFTGWYDDEGRNRVPFELHRVEAAFGERPEPVERPLVAFEGPGAEVHKAFNEDVGNVRVVLLLSPT